MNVRIYRDSDQDAVVSMWEACGLVKPWNDPRRDIERKLKDSPELFLVGEVDGKLVSVAMAGYEGHRGWVNYLAVSPQCRGAGYGRLMMSHIEGILLDLGCPKVNLQVRETNQSVLAFYDAIGYKVDAAVSLGKRLISDTVPIDNPD